MKERLGSRTSRPHSRHRGYVRLRERTYPGSVAHSAGIDRYIVQSTSVCWAPRAIPLIGRFPDTPEPAGRENPPIAAKPACPPPCPPRANEAAGGIKTMNNAIVTLTEMLDMGSAAKS